MRTSINLPDEVFKKGTAQAKLRGFSQSFSAYLAWLIERDAAGAVQREEVAPPAQVEDPRGAEDRKKR